MCHERRGTSGCGPANHRRPQDFAQIRVASDKSRQALDFSAIPRGNRSWVAASGGELQLVGGTRPGASWSLPVNLPPDVHPGIETCTFAFADT